MKKLFLFSMLIVGSLAIRIESATAGRTIAILPFSENSGNKNPVMSASEKQQLLETIRGIARRSLPKADGWKVISSNAVTAKVGAELSNCNGEEACLLSAGRKIPADYIVTADVGRIGSYLEVSFSLFYVASGQLIGSEWPRGKTADDIIDSLESSPDRLFANLSPPVSGSDMRAPNVAPNNVPSNSSGEVGDVQSQSVPDTQVILDDRTYYDPVIVEPYYYGSPYYYWGGSSWIYYGGGYGGHGYYHGHGGGFHGGHGGGGHGGGFHH